MKRVIFRTATSINFIGVSENDGAAVNEWRKVSSDLFDAINIMNRRYDIVRPHKGKTFPFEYSFEDEDEYGRYKAWKFPVFVTNEDELYIYLKIWLRGGVHGGSCSIWCDNYVMYDIRTAGQFETQINHVVNFATKQVKSESKK